MTAVHEIIGPERHVPGEAEPEPPRSIVLDVIVGDTLWGGSDTLEPLLEQAAVAVARRLGLTQGTTAAVMLSSDGHVRELNRIYRGADKPTNVLSFRAPAALEPAPERFLGDIILARETVAREAAEQDKPFLHHLQHLVVHGLLHLAGYDHESPDEAAEMERIEIDVLERLGVPDPYAETA
jgi:probable rRNA maturation factor